MANNTVGLNRLKLIFNDIANRSYFIKSFGWGHTHDISADFPTHYPLLWVEPDICRSPNIDNRYNTIEYGLNVYVLDKIEKGELNFDDTIQDTMLAIQAIIAELGHSNFYVDMNIDLVNDITYLPVSHQTIDNVNGWEAQLSLKVPMRYTECNIPIQPIPGWTSSLVSDTTSVFEYILVNRPPILSISTDNPILEIGNSEEIIVNWSVTKRKYGIQSININIHNGIDPDENINIPVNSDIQFDYSTDFTIQSGTISYIPNPISDLTFTLIITDTLNNTFSQGTTIQFLNNFYWGTIPTFGALNDSDIINANGAGIGDGHIFATSLEQTLNNINGGGDYIFFAWPTSFGEPLFQINGFEVNAFTKVNDTYSFTNDFGYPNDYDVWMTNTIQYSPIDIFKIINN